MSVSVPETLLVRARRRPAQKKSPDGERTPLAATAMQGTMAGLGRPHVLQPQESAAESKGSRGFFHPAGFCAGPASSCVLAKVSRPGNAAFSGRSGRKRKLPAGILLSWCEQRDVFRFQSRLRATYGPAPRGSISGSEGRRRSAPASPSKGVRARKRGGWRCVESTAKLSATITLQQGKYGKNSLFKPKLKLGCADRHGNQGLFPDVQKNGIHETGNQQGIGSQITAPFTEIRPAPCFHWGRPSASPSDMVFGREGTQGAFIRGFFGHMADHEIVP